MPRLVGEGAVPVFETGEKPYLRSWFCTVIDHEGMEEALTILKQFLEENLCEHRRSRIELFIQTRFRKEDN